MSIFPYYFSSDSSLNKKSTNKNNKKGVQSMACKSTKKAATKATAKPKKTKCKPKTK